MHDWEMHASHALKMDCLSDFDHCMYSELAKKVREDWNKVMWFIVYDQASLLSTLMLCLIPIFANIFLRKSFAPEQLVLSLIIGGLVGLGFGFVATVAASTAKTAMSVRSQASSVHSDKRLGLLPMR